MKVAFCILLVCLGGVWTGSEASAHEVRSAYLELSEQAPGQYEVDWKIPIRAGRPLAVVAHFPEDCVEGARTENVTDTGFRLSSFLLSCQSKLEGRRVVFAGLELTITDILVRFEPAEGAGQTLRATPDKPQISILPVSGSWQVAGTYFVLGVEHILLGLDHLLFVLALVLLLPGVRKLIETITAFTLAHSVTLVGASLGWFALPSVPVEAVIALSIIFLASEVAKKREGHLQLSERRPWLVAAAFGLLHGFGFAGALSEIGLPQSDILLALTAFNLGVEAGQLAFVALLLVLLRCVDALRLRQPVDTFISYSIGIIASVWLFERMI